MSMYPSQSLGMGFTTLQQVRDWYHLPQDLWQAFVARAGDPQDDLRLLSVLPPIVVATSLEGARLPDGSPLTAVQASHVGLVYFLAKRIQHTRSGGDWDQWKEPVLFGDVAANNSPTAPTTTPTNLPADRKLKMTQVLDQADDGEFIVENESTKAAWYQQYHATMGGWPPEEEEASVEQLSALARRLSTQSIAPFVDFGVWVPYGAKALRASRFRTWVMTGSGFVQKELPGPSSFTQWRTCFRVLRTALICLDACTVSALQRYESHIESMARLYPHGWHLIYAADEVARSNHSNRLKAQIHLDIRAGKAPPTGWDHNRPWDYVFRHLPDDEGFWRQQVHSPAIAWIASGSKGTPCTPAEQVAGDLLPGGLKTITPSTDRQGNKVDEPKVPSTKQQLNRQRRESRKRKYQNDKEELQALRSQTGKGSGKTSKGSPNKKQKCYSWNNGNGACGGLAPGLPCASATPREHRCTICDSPGHPSRECPQRKG